MPRFRGLLISTTPCFRRRTPSRGCSRVSQPRARRPTPTSTTRAGTVNTAPFKLVPLWLGMPATVCVCERVCVYWATLQPAGQPARQPQRLSTRCGAVRCVALQPLGVLAMDAGGPRNPAHATVTRADAALTWCWLRCWRARCCPVPRRQILLQDQQREEAQQRGGPGVLRRLGAARRRGRQRLLRGGRASGVRHVASPEMHRPRQPASAHVQGPHGTPTTECVSALLTLASPHVLRAHVVHYVR